MDKRVIFAVAGSGKTTLIIDCLNEVDNSLILTFTNNNHNNLRLGIIRKFGYFPKNLFLFSYFTFLYSFCFKPFLQFKYRVKGINYQPNWNRFAKGEERYIDKNRRVFSNRLAKLLEENDLYEEINQRISKYFNNLYIDEVQDFAGHDFNLLKNMCRSKVNILMVGDFFQHTYDTSRDGNVNSTLHEDFDKYKYRFQEIGVDVDLKSLNKSYRCSPTVYKFISNEIGIPIRSHRDDETSIKFIDNKEDAERIMKSHVIVKLFYQEHYKYDCFSRNWGDSKGEDKYKSVCILLNKNTHLFFKNKELQSLPTITRNKLYVACTRVRNTLYFIPEEIISSFKID
jgi:DNA helicase II / ATP-dependent DNA helicase PcrA